MLSNICQWIYEGTHPHIKWLLNTEIGFLSHTLLPQSYPQVLNKRFQIHSAELPIMLFQRNSPAFAALSGLLATATLLASFGPSATRALSLDDIPSSCHSQCSQSVSLLNSCGLDTDGSNADSGNISCFCDGYGNSGYDSYVAKGILPRQSKAKQS